MGTIAPAHAENKYLSPGDDVKTVLEGLRPGDALYINSGTYNIGNMNINAWSGRGDAPIYVGAVDGRYPPVFYGAIRFDHPDFWNIHNIKFQNSPSSGGGNNHTVSIYGGANWIFQYNEVSDASASGAFANIGLGNFGANGSNPGTPPANYYLVDNCVHDAGNSTGDDSRFHNIYNASAGNNWGFISRNILYNAPYGSQIKLGNDVAASKLEGPSHVTVQYNTLFNSDRGILLVGGVTSNTIKYNLVKTTPHGGVDVHGSTRPYNPAADETPNRVNLNFFRTPYGANGPVVRTDERVVAGTTTEQNNRPGTVGNAPEPSFNGVGCGLLNPSNSIAARYGRYSSYFPGSY